MNWKMAKAASAGTDSGRTTLVNIWKCVAPSMKAGLEQVARQLADEVVEQEDCQWQAEAGMRQPDARNDWLIGCRGRQAL